MELNPAILREILLYVKREARIDAPVQTWKTKIDGYSDEDVQYHFWLLCDDGAFALHSSNISLDDWARVGEWPRNVVYGLTSRGHHRLAVLERDDLFRYIQDQAKSQGSSFVFGFMQEIASSWVKKKVGLDS